MSMWKLFLGRRVGAAIGAALALCVLTPRARADVLAGWALTSNGTG